MASNVLVNAFVTGAASTNEQTAQSNFDTALTAITPYRATTLTVLSSGMGMVNNAGTITYKFWAFIQYYSA